MQLCCSGAKDSWQHPHPNPLRQDRVSDDEEIAPFFSAPLSSTPSLTSPALMDSQAAESSVWGQLVSRRLILVSVGLLYTAQSHGLSQVKSKSTKLRAPNRRYAMAAPFLKKIWRWLDPDSRWCGRDIYLKRRPETLKRCPTDLTTIRRGLWIGGAGEEMELSGGGRGAILSFLYIYLHTCPSCLPA